MFKVVGLINNVADQKELMNIAKTALIGIRAKELCRSVK